MDLKIEAAPKTRKRQSIKIDKKLVQDYHNGISDKEALKRIESVLKK